MTFFLFIVTGNRYIQKGKLQIYASFCSLFQIYVCHNKSILTQQIYVYVLCEVVFLFFLLTVKISDLCHTIITFSVLCSLLSDLCIDLPIATIGRTGLCVLQIGEGRWAYIRGIDDHSALSNIRYFGHK